VVRRPLVSTRILDRDRHAGERAGDGAARQRRSRASASARAWSCATVEKANSVGSVSAIACQRGLDRVERRQRAAAYRLGDLVRRLEGEFGCRREPAAVSGCLHRLVEAGSVWWPRASLG
jgi:hypothetical protein